MIPKNFTADSSRRRGGLNPRELSILKIAITALVMSISAIERFKKVK